MSQATVATWLAIRDLWISFRLILLLAAYVGSGVLVALVPASMDTAYARLAAGLAVATGLTAAVAAWSIAADRHRGRAGWLVSRSVPRSTLVGAWFVAIALVVLPALAIAGVLGWLSSPGAVLGHDPTRFGLAVTAVGGVALAAVALGLLLGTLLPGPVASPLAGLLATAATLLPLALPSPPVTLPSVALASGAVGSPPVLGAGGALLATAVLLGAARVAIGRVDL